jgi:hypothetical protein
MGVTFSFQSNVPDLDLFYLIGQSQGLWDLVLNHFGFHLDFKLGVNVFNKILNIK